MEIVNYKKNQPENKKVKTMKKIKQIKRKMVIIVHYFLEITW